MNTIKHEPIEFETMEIGGQHIQVSVKTADKIRARRRKLAQKNARISKELREARLLPNHHGTGNKHAFCITPKYSVRKRDKTASETRQAIIHGQNIARKNDLNAEWEKAKATAFKI
jgi:hypothetical protein